MGMLHLHTEFHMNNPNASDISHNHQTISQKQNSRGRHVVDLHSTLYYLNKTCMLREELLLYNTSRPCNMWLVRSQLRSSHGGLADIYS